MQKTIASSALSFAVLALPALASAADIFTLLVRLSSFLNGLIGVAVTLAIVVFFWGLIRYLFQGGAEGKHEGLKIMFYGVVTIFVMVSVWGLVRLLQGTFQVGSSDPIIPKGIQINTAL